MKKIISIVLLAALCLCLAACGSAPAAEPTPTATPEPTATPAPTPEPTATPEPEKDQAELLQSFASLIEKAYLNTNIKTTATVDGNTVSVLMTMDGFGDSVSAMRLTGDYSSWNSMKESMVKTSESIRITGEALGLTDFVLKITIYDDKSSVPLVSWTDGEQAFDLVGD